MKSGIIKNVTFEDIWLRLSNQEKNICCTRSYSPEGWQPFIAWNPINTYTGQDTNSFNSFVNGEQEKGNRVFGYLSYDLGYSLFNIRPHSKNDLGLPEIFFYSFGSYIKFIENGIEVIAADEKTLELYLTQVNDLLMRSKVTHDSKVSKTESELVTDIDKETYSKSYKKIKNYIIEGDIYQINLTHRLEGTTKKGSHQLFLDMCEKNKVDYIAYIEADDFEILSASPEQFIKISSDRTIETFPIKGTRPRGKNPEEDEILKNELMNSSKEAAELNMITDLLRNDLGKISEIGSIQVVGSRIIHPYATVWHTYSHIKGKVLSNLKSVDALLSMFPGGSITGCPKKRAMEIIDELEPTMRGIYTGCIGFIDPDDSLDFNIAIRTFIKKGDKVFLQVGGGIVYDSNEKDEYQETLDKVKSFLGII
ncbi:MAG TPA: anthranilate synthase component I family protein [Candidatus Jorgensenbacteria bacterium]|nr:anthranilate synthase component I family protein [Candidatus Jorgensenbacteria bacterium]